MKKLAHKKFKITNLQCDYSIFSELRKECNNLSKITQANHIIKIQNNIYKNIKSFWKYIQSLKSNKSNIPTSVFLDDEIANNISESTKLFANYFSSVYVENKYVVNLNDFPPVNNINLNLNTWYISEDEIEDFLNTLNDKSGVGPDSIPPTFLKSCIVPLIKPLHYLFNLSLSTGVFSDYWKQSFITPIFKSGDKNNIRNYRPISKLSIIPKIPDLPLFLTSITVY